MRLTYNNLDGNIRRLFFISKWQAVIKSSLYHSAVCYYHLGSGSESRMTEKKNMFYNYE